MRRQRLPLVVLIWIVALLAGLVILLANQGAVDRIMAATGLERALYPNGKSPSVAVLSPPNPAPTVLVDPLPVLAAPAPLAPPAALPPVPTVEDSPPAGGEQALPDKPNTYRLFFLRLTPEGRLDPASFVRELPAGMTPLTATIQALLLGPTLQDKAQGAITMIPAGTKLLSVRLKDHVALLSFSNEFEHNTSGVEGLAGELRQVVWTATQFSTVDAVQFLIDGQFRDSLADGAIPTSRPLNRTTVP